MKKLISIVLTIAMLCAFVPSALAAEKTALTVDMTNYGNAAIEVLAENTKDAGSYLVAAAYSEDGELLEAKEIVDKRALLQYKDTAKIKVFSWKSKNDMTPSCDAYEAKISDVKYSETVKIEGVVTGTYLSNPYYTAGDDYVKIVVSKSESPNFCKTDVMYSFHAGNLDVRDILGHSVEAQAALNAMGEYTLYSISEKNFANKSITVAGDYIKDFALKGDNSDAGYISYYESDEARNATFAAITDEVSKYDTEYGNIVINGFNAAVYTDDFLTAGNLDVNDIYNYEFNGITLLDNDNDEDFEFVFAEFACENSLEFVVDEVDRTNHILTGVDGYNTLEADYDDENMLVTVIKDGETIGFDQIMSGDVVTVFDAGMNVLTIYVSSNVVSGEIEEIENYEKFTIGGRVYTVSRLSYLFDDYLSVGDEGEFYIDYAGKIAEWLPPSSLSSAEYVYVMDAGMIYGDWSGDENYAIKAADASGNIRTIPLRKTEVHVHADGIDEYDEYRAADALYIIMEYLPPQYDEYAEAQGLIKIITDGEGQITDVYIPEYQGSGNDFEVSDKYAHDAWEEAEHYSAKNGTYGELELPENTAVFNIETGDIDFTGFEDAITTSTVGEALKDGVSYNFKAYFENGIIKAIVTEDAGVPQIAEPDSPAINTEYVYVMDAGMIYGDWPGDDIYAIKAADANGNIRTIPLRKTKVHVHADGIDEYAEYRAADALDIIMAYLPPQYDEYAEAQGLIKIITDGKGQITDVYIPEYRGSGNDFEVSDKYAYDAWEEAEHYSAKNGTYGELELPENTAVFNIETGDIDFMGLEDTLTVSTVGKALKDGVSYNFKAYFENGMIKAIVTEDAGAPQISEPDNPAINTEYVYVTDAGMIYGDWPGDEIYAIKAADASGNIRTIPLRKTKVHVHADGIDEYAEYRAADALDIIMAYLPPQYDEYAKAQGLIKITTDGEGQITDVYIPEYRGSGNDFEMSNKYAHDAWEETEYYSAKSGKYGELELPEDTTVFNIETGDIDFMGFEDALTVSTVGKVFQDGLSYNFTAYFDGNVIKAIVTTDAECVFNPENPVMVVTNNKIVRLDDELTYELTGVVAGETVSIVVNPEYIDDADWVEPGNVIIYGVDCTGLARDVKILLASNEYGVNEDTLDGTYDGTILYYPSDSDVNVAVGKVAQKEKTYFTLENDEIMYFPSIDCNYTLVEFGRTVIVTPSTWDKIGEATTLYDYYVFVKTTEDSSDEITDAVIFKVPRD